MITRPNPVYHGNCTHQVPVSTYRAPRISLGPDARSIVVNIDRAMGVGFSTVTAPVFTLNVSREAESFTLTSSGYANYQAVFDVVDPAHFLARGLYNAQVMFGDCCVGNIEIVNAPSYYVNGAATAESDCAESTWVEPACDAEDSCAPTAQAGCECDDKGITNTCSTCNTSVPHGMETRSGYGT